MTATEVENLGSEVLSFLLDSRNDKKSPENFARHVSDEVIRLARLYQSQSDGKLRACGSLHDVLRNRLSMSETQADLFIGSLRESGIYHQVTSRLASYLPRV